MHCFRASPGNPYPAPGGFGNGGYVPSNTGRNALDVRNSSESTDHNPALPASGGTGWMDGAEGLPEDENQSRY